MDTSPLKKSFIEVFERSGLDFDVLANVARDVAGVPRMAVRDMMNASPVCQHDAEGVLRILSQHTGKIYTLETVDVQLLPPTFAEIFCTHSIDKKELAERAEVTPDMIDLMIQGQRILKIIAEKVLLALSAMTNQDYTLENVDVNILVIISNQSAVATLMQRIDEEYTACKQGLEGLAEGTSHHKSITARMENIAAHTDALHTYVDKGTVNQLLQQYGE